jgi:hypothetical protein
MLFLDRGGEPCRFNLAFLDARIGEGFDIGFDHEIFRVIIPAFAEIRAAHSENGNFILNS